MPLIDWTRTDLAAPLPRGGTVLRFEATKMAALDIHMLGRAGAKSDWPESVRAQARAGQPGRTGQADGGRHGGLARGL